MWFSNQRLFGNRRSPPFLQCEEFQFFNFFLKNADSSRSGFSDPKITDYLSNTTLSRSLCLPMLCNFCFRSLFSVDFLVLWSGLGPFDVAGHRRTSFLWRCVIAAVFWTIVPDPCPRSMKPWSYTHNVPPTLAKYIFLWCHIVSPRIFFADGAKGRR